MRVTKKVQFHKVHDLPGGECAKLTLKRDGGRSGRGGLSAVRDLGRCRIFARAELVETTAGAGLRTVQ